ncbi:MAG: hypothetical protein JJU29_16175 [Verrucomicrobia bacterium]|nr:hypothetical protein [Verrucomicrobiota bacterium]MCH8513589.1 hypothetical protein [Kiritimatiellia bacterium]
MKSAEARTMNLQMNMVQKTMMIVSMVMSKMTCGCRDTACGSSGMESDFHVMQKIGFIR